MKHPPIPPGCENFIRERDGRLEAALVFPLDFRAAHPATEPFNAHQRGIVAAYCEVAWRKEAKRLPFTRSIDSGKAKARDNARAWRKWGSAT